MDATRFKKELDLAQVGADIEQLKRDIAMLDSENHELWSLKEGRNVYMRQGNIFFLADTSRTKSSKQLDIRTKKQQLEQLTKYKESLQ
mmetsp:Transcript_130026/g.193593  ORF Transcript_130026/g.193593 Transcript_130026/m.193593 type:complete len:88 (-) Transcript_130026:25-288(-)